MACEQGCRVTLLLMHQHAAAVPAVGWQQGWQQGKPTVCATLSACCAALSARGTAASPTAAAAFCASLDTDCRQGKGDVKRRVIAACDIKCSSMAPGSKGKSLAAQRCQPTQLHMCSLTSCHLPRGYQMRAAPQRCWPADFAQQMVQASPSSCHGELGKASRLNP